MTSLVCDIGGTNTRLGLVEDDRILGDTLASFGNDGFGGFEALLDAYMKQLSPGRLDAVCIALAAVATPEGAKLTNRDWLIRRDGVAALTRASSVGFINDFEALGFALLRVEALETTPLFGTVEPGAAAGARMVLGAARVSMPPPACRRASAPSLR